LGNAPDLVVCLVRIYFWLFVTPFNIMGYRMLKYSVTHDILKKRFEAGEITNEEYHEKKKIIASK